MSTPNEWVDPLNGTPPPDPPTWQDEQYYKLMDVHSAFVIYHVRVGYEPGTAVKKAYADMKPVFDVWDENVKAIEAYAAALRDCVTAMKRSSEEGTTDHLDCCEDGGAFWHGAIEKAEALLNGH